jgi:hypothetical protein
MKASLALKSVHVSGIFSLLRQTGIDRKIRRLIGGGYGL